MNIFCRVAHRFWDRFRVGRSVVEEVVVELNEFVKRTIEEIITGVKASHEHALTNGASVAIASNCAEIKFDVSVTASATGESKKGAGIFVGGFGIGAQGKTATTSF